MVPFFTNGMEKNIDKLKQRLEDEKTKLEGELGIIGRRSKSNPNDWEAVPPETEEGGEPDLNIAADMVEGFEGASAVEGELEQRLSEVVGALKRIDDETYGICRICKKPVEEERLNANPAASTCISHRNE